MSHTRRTYLTHRALESVRRIVSADVNTCSVPRTLIQIIRLNHRYANSVLAIQ